MATTIRVNGVSHTVDVDSDTPLLWVLRDVLGMTGTKFGCGMALCGACTVHVDGAAVRSCITPIDSIRRKRNESAGTQSTRRKSGENRKAVKDGRTFLVGIEDYRGQGRDRQSLSRTLAGHARRSARPPSQPS